MTDYTSLPADLPVPEDDGAAATSRVRRCRTWTAQAPAGDAVHLDALGAGRTVIYIYPLTGRPGTDLPEGWDDDPRSARLHPRGLRLPRPLPGAARRRRGRGVRPVQPGRPSTSARSSSGSTCRSRCSPTPRWSLADELDLPTFEAGGMTLYKRLTLIIRDGMIEHVFYPVFPPNEHADQVLTWLRENPL